MYKYGYFCKGRFSTVSCHVERRSRLGSFFFSKREDYNFGKFGEASWKPGDPLTLLGEPYFQLPLTTPEGMEFGKLSDRFSPIGF